MLETSGSVRIDLLGGTIDLPPINLILSDTVTLNLATSLKASVKVSSHRDGEVVINSLDYQSIKTFSSADFCRENLKGEFFGPLRFVALILDYFNIHGGVKIEIESGSPPGAGLGGSSSMGVVLFKAMADWTKQSFSRADMIKIVNGIEATILNAGPAGYQDYYPALYGGVLALIPHYRGVEVKQLFTLDLKTFLEKHLTLVFSGENRDSGINNWEVYKRFFDGQSETRQGLTKIANLSQKAYQAISSGQFSELLKLIVEEGKTREKLFPDILSPSMKKLASELKKNPHFLGLKVCGAGGGGCFLIAHSEEGREEMVQYIQDATTMRVLDFEVGPPLENQ
jgi:D-glycero-alpha-D-manno-heptose-7-phosphate kinase